MPQLSVYNRKTSFDKAVFSAMNMGLFIYLFIFIFYFYRTITIFLNKFQYEKKKCSDEEAQEKPQGLCELSFLKI